MGVKSSKMMYCFAFVSKNNTFDSNRITIMTATTNTYFSPATILGTVAIIITIITPLGYAL